MRVGCRYCALGDFGTDSSFLVDYILIMKSDVDHIANPNEVQNTKYVTQEGLKQMFQDNSLTFTPWFKLICNSMLFEWWDHLNEGLDKYKGETEIRRM